MVTAGSLPPLQRSSQAWPPLRRDAGCSHLKHGSIACPVLIHVVLQVLNIYSWIVIGSVLLSWFGLAEDNPLVKISNALVDPVLAPIRKVLPSFGGLDFSPWILVIGIRLLSGALAARAGL